MLKLIRSEWQLLLFGFLMTFWSSPGQTFLISLFSGEIRAELGLSDGEFAGIYSLATLASAIVMVWTGTLVDKVDLKKLSIAIVIGLGLGCGRQYGQASDLGCDLHFPDLGAGLVCLPLESEKPERN